MKVAIHQPQYWPWPPYIHKVMSCDTFVYLDTVQFSKNGLQNRNQIKTRQGASWLSLPVKQRFGQSILETKIAELGALKKHWKTLQANYAPANGFQLWKAELEILFSMDGDSLCEVAIASTEWILAKLGVQTKRVRASEIPSAGGAGTALVASICKSLGATSYLTGVGAVAYLERNLFSAMGCEVWVQEWKRFDYGQRHSEVGFIPDLSTLDLLLNVPERAAAMIESAGNWALLWDAISECGVY